MYKNTVLKTVFHLTSALESIFSGTELFVFTTCKALDYDNPSNFTDSNGCNGLMWGSIN